jgi:Uma2 family endonuclease
MNAKSLIDRLTPENSIVVSSTSWELYEEVLYELNERHVFVTFTGRRLELMLPSFRHIRAAESLATLVGLLAELTARPVVRAGSTTLRRRDLRKGLEPDRGFYLQNAMRMVARDDLDLTIDPPPDLVLEIEISKRRLNRIRIYEDLGVPEVWRYDGRLLRVLARNSNGRLEPRRRSPTFPDNPVWEIHASLQSGLKAVDETSWINGARNWFSSRHAPRATRE